MLRAMRYGSFLCAAWLLVGSAAAEAQWVMVARKTIGKVKQLTQSDKSDGPGYSVATVLVNGEAENVFAAALKSVGASTRVQLKKKDPAKLTLEFADGKQAVGLEVTQVGEKLVHLVIATTVTPGKPDEAAVVVDAALRICKEAGAECSVVKPE